MFVFQDFAINLENKVSSINEALQMKSLTFVIDACKVLAQARKVSMPSLSLHGPGPCVFHTFYTALNLHFISAFEVCYCPDMKVKALLVSVLEVQDIYP